MKNYYLCDMKHLLSLLFILCGLQVEAAVYNIRDFGAKNDTTVLSTRAIQAAIDRCSAEGGGQVLIPAGHYKMGTIVLRSQVNVHLEKGAVLYGSTDIDDYTPQRTSYVSLRTNTPTVQLIWADNVENVTIDGEGVIDGRGKSFPKLSWNDEGITRPHLLRFVQSRDVQLKGITLRNSGCWMQHWLACDRVMIDGITVINRNNYNNDALDLDGCHEVVVSNMICDSDDDGITLKSTSPRLCENISISNCVVSSHCNAVKLGTETNGGFRNITIQNICVKPSYDQSSQFFGHESKRGTSALSLEIVDGGVMENVNISNFTVEGTESPIFIRLANRARSYCDSVKITKVGSIDGVRISNFLVSNAGPTGCSITGMKDYPVRNIFLRDIFITQKGGQPETDAPIDEKLAEYPEATMWGILPAKGFWVNHARNVHFENVCVKTLNPDQRPLFFKEDCE